MRQNFTREEVSSITMIVGIFYLVYSAYFIASDIPSLKLIIVLFLVFMYLWVWAHCVINVWNNYKFL